MAKKDFLKALGMFALNATKSIYPAVALVESGVKGFIAAKSSDEKLDAAEAIALASITTAEQVAERDLLNDAKVRETYRALISAHVAFMNALAAAKEVRVKSAS